MPARIPESTKTLRGTARKDRAPALPAQISPSAKFGTEPASPAPPGSRWEIPLAPPEADLDPVTWWELAQAVNERQCATNADRVAFREMVSAVALLRRATAELMESGFVYETASGARKASPAVAIWATASKTACGLLDRFGLSPSMRERVAAVPSATENDHIDEAAAFFFGGGRLKHQQKGNT